MTTPTGFTPYFGYRDAAAAIEFLTAAFGFEIAVRYDGEDGRVMHAELRAGEAILMLGSTDEKNNGSSLPVGTGIYLTVDEPDEHYERSMEAGAEIVWEPHDTEFGTRRYRVRDTEGYEWSFGNYRPGSSNA